jgi:hypothetical protein
MGVPEPAMANVFGIVVGRLVEVRINAAVLTAADVDTWFNGVAAAMSRLPSGQRGVVVADWRRCPLMSDEAATRAAARLTQANPSVERSAALASSESAITVLQFLRLCRDTNPSGNRRLYTNAHEMIAWLSERLTQLEISRLRAFLDEPTRHAALPR